MTDRLSLINTLAEIHRTSLENHCRVLRDLISALDPETSRSVPRTQHIIVTGPTTASALAPLPGTELILFRSIPQHRRIWSHCLVSNFRFEQSSFIRRFLGCGHYFWYRCDFEIENGLAKCPQCAAEEAIISEEQDTMERGRRRATPPSGSPSTSRRRVQSPHPRAQPTLNFPPPPPISSIGRPSSSRGERPGTDRTVS
jgi:hypothetical protein